MSQRMYVVSQQLIANNIEAIAAACWNGYQRDGRGLILIDGSEAVSLESTASPMTYLSGPTLQSVNEEWVTGNLAGTLKTYQPDTEIVVVLKWRGEVGIYRLKPPTAPPAAAEQLNRRFSPQ